MNNTTQNSELIEAVKSLLNEIWNEDVTYPSLNKVEQLVYKQEDNNFEASTTIQTYDQKKIEEWLKLTNKTSFTLEELIEISNEKNI